MPIYVKFTHERHVRPFVDAFDQAFPNIEWKWVDHPTSDHKRYLSMPFCQAPNIPGVLWEEDLWVCAEHDEEGAPSIPVYLVDGTEQGAASIIQKAFRKFLSRRGGSTAKQEVQVHLDLLNFDQRLSAYLQRNSGDAKVKVVDNFRRQIAALQATLLELKFSPNFVLCHLLAREVHLKLEHLYNCVRDKCRQDPQVHPKMRALLQITDKIQDHYYRRIRAPRETQIIILLQEFHKRLVGSTPPPEHRNFNQKDQIGSSKSLISAAKLLRSKTIPLSRAEFAEQLLRDVVATQHITELSSTVLRPLRTAECLLLFFPSVASAHRAESKTGSDSGSDTESEDEVMIDTSAFPVVLEVTRDPQFSYPTIAKAVDSVAPRHPHEPYSWLVSAEDLPELTDNLKARGLRLQELFFDDTNKYMKIIPSDHARYEENALLLVAKDLRTQLVIDGVATLTDNPWTESESHWQCTVPCSTLDRLQAIGLLPHSDDDDDEGTFRVAPNDDNDPRYKPRPSRKRKATAADADAVKKARVELRDITEEEFVQEWLAVYEETGATPKTPQELRAIFKKYKHTHSTPAREWSAQENRSCAAMLTELGIEAECVELNQMLPEGATMRSNEPVPQANLLVVREFAQQLGIDMDLLLQQLDAKPMDTLKWSRRAPKTNGKQNKLARHNCCITDGEEEGEEIENGVKITHPKNPEIIFTCWKYQAFPELLKFRWRYAAILGPFGYKVYDQFHELNKYYQKSCGIGRHGDIERGSHGSCGMVNCLKVGFHLPLLFSWYKDCKPAGRTGALSPLDATKASFPVVSMEKKKKGQVQWTTSTVAAVVTLGHGDHYQMSAKALGKDWRTKDWACRHCAGASKYTGLPKTFYQAIEQQYGSQHKVAYSLTGSDRVENDSESPELQFATRFDGM